MRITGNPPLTGVQSKSVKRRSSGGDGGFHPAEAEEAGVAHKPVASTSLGRVDSLLALQEMDDPLTGRRRAVSRGYDLLDQLEGLKMDLLAGRVGAERLERLVGMLERRFQSDDPALEAMVDDIELRVKVELAKLGRFIK